MLIEYGNVLCGPEWKVEEKIPPGYSRVYYVYSGEVTYRDEQCRIKLKPGFLYLFPSASPYRMQQNAQKPLDCTFLHIDLFPSIATSVAEIPMEGSPMMKHLFLSIAASIDSNDIKMTSSLADAFELYCREHRLVQSPAGPVSRTLLYISENIDRNITVADLCGQAGYNAQYYIRLFKKHTGMPPHRYITNFRMKEARKLLRTGMPVSQIAAATGYGDIKSFSRSFKGNIGLSPTDYRRAYTVQP